MGHTHYHELKRDLTPAEFSALGKAAKAIIANSHVPIVYEYDEPNHPAQIDDEIIRFNGLTDAGFETFVIDRIKDGFSCTKTGRRQYDEVVTAVLIAADLIAPGAFDIGSDGGEADWADGLYLARTSMKDVDPLRLQVPARVKGT